MTGAVPQVPIDENSKLRLFGDIVERINLGLSLQEVVDLVYDRLWGVLPYHRVGVAVTDSKREKLVLVAARSDTPMALAPGYAAAIAGSSLEPLLHDGRIRILNDLAEYAGRHPESTSTRLIVKEGMRSSLTLPLLVRGKGVGVMFFSSRIERAYRPEHEEYLRGVAGHIAIAVERLRLTDALRDRTTFLESVLEGSADAILVCDSNHQILSWNLGAVRMFGYAPEEAIGRSVDLIAPEDLRASGELKRIADHVCRHGFMKGYETRRVTKDGRTLEINLTTTAVKDSQGKIIGRSSILRDVTETRRLHDQLARARSLATIGELAASIAHEVRNPLAGISGAVQVLGDALPSSDSRRSIIPEILDQIGRLDRTVRDLLLFARPPVVRARPVDLSESLAHAWSLIARDSKSGEVSFELTGEAVEIQADPDLLQQVWINLIQNGVEAMSHRGRIRVRVWGGTAPRVLIEDEGPGIPEDQLGRLFSPFYSTKTRGTGLGLAISRKIVEAHGGSIHIESRPSEGARVFVEFHRNGVPEPAAP